MPFSIDDMLENMGLGGQKKIRECYREDIGSFKKASKEEIAKIFPNVTLSDSSEVLYAPFRLCHSLPKVNMRGRCFTPKVLNNSFASVRDAAMNIDHQMKYRNQGGGDTICGHVVCGRFDPDGLYKEEMASMAKLPTEPIPLMALAAFYLRSEHIPSVLKQHLSGERKWLTSMECAHNIEEAAFLYRGELIPIKDAEAKMRECVGKNSVRPYKGHELALALGGECGSVDFHAAALTPDPADDDASIMAFVTKDKYLEAANAGDKNPFFFPLETHVFTSPPNITDEVTIDELANIAVIGQTDACDDGHGHDVLSDGTVMPHGGHMHRLSNFNLTRGSNPRLTGRTDSHYQSMPDGNGGSKSHEHLHTVNIPLKGKSGTKPAGTKGDSIANLPPQELPFVPVTPSVEFPMDKLLERMLAVLAAGKFEGTTATEVASLTAELRKTGQDSAIKQLIKTEIANLTTAGELVSKEDHQAKLDAAVKAEKDKADAEKKEAEARAARREKVFGIGLALDDKFDDKPDSMTVGQFVDSFPLNEGGDKSFQVALSTLETVKKLTTPAPTTETQAANKPKEEKEKKDEQANKPARKPLLIVGRGDGEGGGGSEEAANKGGKKVGRELFSASI
jgi:hypothetical protein